MLGIFSMLIATLLLSLVSFSTPLNQAMDMFRLDVSNYTESFAVPSTLTELRFGVWGFCQSEVSRLS